MGKFIFVLIPWVSIALTLEGLNQKFPDRAIDFLIETKSFAESERGNIPLRDYTVESLGNNIYRLKMFFYLPPKVKKHKLFSGVHITETVHSEVKLKLQTTFWYRGGRIISFESEKGTKTFDLQPKCYLLQKGEKLVPTYGGGDVVFTTPQGVKVHLFLTFTRCEF